MKITIKKLRKIIKEELDKELSEEAGLNEANPHHDKKGRWTSEKDSEIYSFTKGAKVDPKLQLRGKYKGRKNDGLPNVQAKMGANTASSPDKQCGRTVFGTGEEKEPTLSCQDYNQPYRSIKEDNDDNYIKAVIKQEIAAYLKQARKNITCRPSLSDFLRFQHQLSLAQNTDKK